MRRIVEPLRPIARKIGVKKVVDFYRQKKLDYYKKHPFTKEQLSQQMRDLGICSGDTIMLHSGLKSLGYVEAGADTVIDAALLTIGSSGTLCVPVYPISDWSVSNLERLPVLENDSPSFLGKVPSVFLKRPGVFRSKHPTHSWAGIGPDAEWLLKEHHLSVTPCGQGSPFEKILEKNGWILIFGSTFGNCTFWHATEDSLDMPVQVYLDKDFTAPVRLADGEVFNAPFKLHHPDLTPLRVDQNEEHQEFLFQEYKKLGHLKLGKAGAGRAIAIRARDFYNDQIHLFKRGITLYKTK